MSTLMHRTPSTAVAVMLAAWVAAPLAQTPPLRKTPIVEPAAVEPSTVPKAAPTPQSVVQVFLDACVLNEGQPSGTIDWALAQGFEPLDPLVTGAEELLGGAEGTVLAVPGTAGRVLLAAAQGRRCVVWAQRQHGPALRAAFQKMVSGLRFKGARVELVSERNLASAGAWRHQSQWRYRRVGGDQDFGLGSATTLVDAPGAQLLHFAPLQPAARPEPDGMPGR